jgi:signal transduction histidine kinase
MADSLLDQRVPMRSIETLRKILFIVFVFAVLFVAIGLILGGKIIVSMSLVTASVCALSYWLMEHKYYSWAAWLMSATLIGVAVFSASMGSGIYDVSVLMIPVSVIFAGMVLPVGHVNYFVIVILSSAIFLSVGHHIGVIAPQATEVRRLEDHILFPLMILGIHLLMVQTLQRLRRTLYLNERERRKWEILFATVGDGIMLLNQQGKIVAVNPILQMWLDAFLHEEEDGFFCSLSLPFWPIAENQSQYQWNIPQSSKHPERICELTVKLVYLTENPLWMASIRDVTEERQLRAKLLQDSTVSIIGRLSATIAHDLNNQLASIVALSGLQEDADDVVEMRELATEIGGVALRAAKRTSHVLSTVNRDAQSLTLVHIMTLLQDVHRKLSLQLASNMTLDMHSVPSIEPILLDYDRVFDALMNLGLNAIDAVRDVSVARIHLGCKIVPTGVEFWISDNGRGMSPIELQRVREIFYTTKPDGTGLGLFSVDMCATAHGGRFQIDSIEGEGTTCKILIPTKSPQTVIEPTQPIDLSLLTESSQIIRVLLVEDNEPLALMLKRAVENAGMEMFWASSGEECKEILGTGQAVDVVVVDYQLPDCTGDQLLSEFSSQTPIIAISGNIESWDGYSTEYPIYKKISKPFLASDLIDEIQSVHAMIS